jgi:multiple sugar transport system substrate-binding protein
VRAAALLLACGCGIGAMPPPPEVEARPLAIELAHLRGLGMDLVIEGRPVRAVALYAEAPDYRPAPSPARDGSEGVACLDDAARAAVLYLRLYEHSGDPSALAEARGLLAFVAAMEQGDGEYVNFVAADGAPNREALTSRKSASYWAARALWALGEAVRVLGESDPSTVAALEPMIERTVARIGRELEAGELVGGSTTATAEALLGLLALDEKRLAARAADLLVARADGSIERPPWGAHVDPASGDWHAWGARTVEALARAAVVLDRPALAAAARREADGLWPRLLLSGAAPASVATDGEVTPGAEIAYGVSPRVGGYLALAAATGEERYAELAGLAAAWLTGANPSGEAMYDEASGRVYDGVGPGGKINRNSGAESTVEGLLAALAVAADPVAAGLVRYAPRERAPALVARPPETREWKGPGGDRLILRRAPGEPGGLALERAGAAPVRLTYWPAASPVEVELARELAASWNQDHPDIQVSVQPIPAGRTSEEVLLAAIVSRSTPDVCSNITAPLLARLHRARAVVRLDTIPATAARLRERATAAMIEPTRLPDGGLYAMPWKVNPMMILYNAGLLEAAGVSPPRTHSELLAAARKLARDTDGDGRLDRWAMWMPLKMSWHERFYDFYPLYLAASGGRTLLEGGEVAFDNRHALAAVSLLRAGFDARVFPRANFSDGRDPFLDGTVAMKMIGPWFLRELEQMKDDDLRYRVTPVPVPDGGDADAAATFADMKSVVVFSTTRHPEAAARFVAYLTSPEADRRLIELTAQLPHRRGLLQGRRFRAALARWPTLRDYARRVERARDLDLHPDIIEILDILSEAYEASAIYGVEPPARALARAADEARVVIGGR